jgi:hypothetical protein
MTSMHLTCEQVLFYFLIFLFTIVAPMQECNLRSQTVASDEESQNMELSEPTLLIFNLILTIG